MDGGDRMEGIPGADGSFEGVDPRAGSPGSPKPGRLGRRGSIAANVSPTAAELDERGEALHRRAAALEQLRLHLEAAERKLEERRGRLEGVRLDEDRGDLAEALFRQLDEANAAADRSRDAAGALEARIATLERDLVARDEQLRVLQARLDDALRRSPGETPADMEAACARARHHLAARRGRLPALGSIAGP